MTAALGWQEWPHSTAVPEDRSPYPPPRPSPRPHASLSPQVQMLTTNLPVTGFAHHGTRSSDLNAEVPEILTCDKENKQPCLGARKGAKSSFIHQAPDSPLLLTGPSITGATQHRNVTAQTRSK